MKSVRNRMALALVAACGLASAAHAQVYSSNPNLAIPDNPTVVATIDVSGFTGTVTDLNVVVNITHTFDGDLDYILIPPGGTGVQFLHLSTDNGSTGDNFTYTRFDNEAAVVIPTTGAPYCGDYRPEGGSMATGWAAVSPYSLAELGTGVADLTAFNGINPNGTWTLVIDDDLGGDTGVLQHWALEFNGAIDPATNNPIVATANASGDANGSAAVSIVATGPCRAGGAAVDSVSVDASPIGGGTVALTGPGTGNTWTGSIPISNSTAPGTYTLTSSATLGAVTVNGVVNLTVRPAAPGCASGSATASFSNMISTAAVSAAIPPATQPGSATTNTIVQSTQTAPGTATALRVTGRYIEANTADLQTENRLRVARLER
ncbi:MAG: proprotein convertase P-domain-containing protein [Phycisphaerales bacterium]